METEMRITTKGQVTIPQEIRELAGFLPHTEVAFVMDGGDVRLIRADAVKGASRGQDLVARMRGRAETPWTTDQIMALTRGELDAV